MKLHQLFSYFINTEAAAPLLLVLEDDVSAICFDARNVTKNSVFVALSGTQNDGHNYITDAIKNGAIALVVENKSRVPAEFPHLVLEVSDSRQMLDVLASRFYNFPSHELFCFGVTGTNGKTSITYILEHIFKAQNKNIGVMGTVNHRVGEKIWHSDMTTPDPVTLQGRLREFLNNGATVAALEISSHALEQKRAHSVHFNTVIFTNLTLDHLDYHKSMKNYFAAKQKLFTDLMWLTTKKPKFAIINIDDSYGKKLKVAEDVFAWTYGKNESDFQFKITKMNFAETEFEIVTALETYKAVLPITGEHTVYNIVASCVAVLSAGISLEQSLKYLKDFNGIPGRLEKVESASEKIVFVDYAHTPDALKNVLNSINKIKKSSHLKNKIITVFGCGGDRDKTKRPIMAEVAASLSDFVFITSDNPRTENAMAIINEIKAGLPKDFKNYEIEIDREIAIRNALAMAQNGDVILIAGKGHEDYQIIGTEKKYFSDVAVAQKYLKGN